MKSAAVREAKLAKLLEIESYDSVESLMEAVFSDSVSPAICMNEDCDFTCEMEPDQDAFFVRALPRRRVFTSSPPMLTRRLILRCASRIAGLLDYQPRDVIRPRSLQACLCHRIFGTFPPAAPLGSPCSASGSPILAIAL
jgi:hypothetical protein